MLSPTMAQDGLVSACAKVGRSAKAIAISLKTIMLSLTLVLGVAGAGGEAAILPTPKRGNGCGARGSGELHAVTLKSRTPQPVACDAVVRRLGKRSAGAV